MSNDTPDYGEVMIDGWKFLLAGPLELSAVDRMPGKVTIGNYQIDSNELLSSWVLQDKTGGHGIVSIQEGVEDNRYRWGTLYTRYGTQWTKPFAIRESFVGSGSVFLLGDLTTSGTVYRYLASGTDLYQNTTSQGSISSAPSEKAVGFTGAGANAMLYIPRGNNGYSVYDPVSDTIRNVNGGSADDNFQAFVVWDNKLVGIANNGQLSYATTATAAADTTFTSYGADAKLDPAFEPKRLHVYRNAAGEPTIYIVTGDGVWTFDAATPRLYRISDFESVHPRFGLASCVWRGNLYVAAGMDILEYNGNVVRNIGLSRDDGLPYNYSAWVRDLVPGQNSLYAFVRGQRPGGGNYYFSVHEYSGFGWHVIDADDDVDVPIRMAISQADSGYRLCWGFNANGRVLCQDLPESFTNPREAIDAGAFAFGYVPSGASEARSYFLQSGWFDGGMRGYRKIANAVQMNVRNLDANHRAFIEYRVDNATSWTQLGGYITTDGITTLPFGTLTDGIYPGLGFERIELQAWIQETSSSTATPAIEWAVFTYLVRKNPSWAWTTTLNLSASHNDKSPEQMFDKLVALKNDDRFYPLIYRGDTYRVRISGLGGSAETGLDTRGTVGLSIIEIPNEAGLPS